MFEKYGRKSRREQFLDEMEQVVPWSGLQALVVPHYAKAGNGRRPVAAVLNGEPRSTRRDEEEGGSSVITWEDGDIGRAAGRVAGGVRGVALREASRHLCRTSSVSLRASL